MKAQLKLTNTLTRKKEDFHPRDPSLVRFYSCGPTTYDFLHVGNARAFVTADLIYRTLRLLEYPVCYVRNFTDIDDKIIKIAQEKGVDPKEHASRFVKECQQDMLSLNMLIPDHTPKVTETMSEIIELIELLIKKGIAYEIEGEVFYHVPKYSHYGRLSKKKLEDLEMGKRVAVDPRKKHPADFVLWKPSKKDEPFWSSPWGPGRPGWHIECSAMIYKFLGKEIDIHHGGVDLIFPHHENEMAQSEGALGGEFCHSWCHNEHLNFGQEKMSKSLGNTVTIRKFVENYGGEVLRQILLSSHYRSKTTWDDKIIHQAFHDLERIHTFIQELEDIGSKQGLRKAQSQGPVHYDQVRADIIGELADDFNAPGAMAKFFTFIRDFRREILSQNKLTEYDYKEAKKIIDLMEKGLGNIFPPQSILEKINATRGKLHSESKQIDPSKIDQLIQERLIARKNKQWSRADEIRDELKSYNVLITDHPDGRTTWKFI